MTRRVTLREAAGALGISKDAVRKRVSRGTLVHDKGEDGRVYVYLPGGGGPGTDAGEDAVPPGPEVAVGDLQRDDRDELIAELRAEVAAWREESRRKDHIIAGLVERLPAQLEAAPEPREATRTGVEPSEGPSPRSGTVGSQTVVQEPRATTRKPWWIRILGG